MTDRNDKPDAPPFELIPVVIPFPDMRGAPDVLTLVWEGKESAAGELPIKLVFPPAYP